MKLKAVTLLYIITIVVVVAAIIWEIYMQQWIAEQPVSRGDVMRVDLFVIWPLVLTLVAISVFRIIQGKK